MEPRRARPSAPKTHHLSDFPVGCEVHVPRMHDSGARFWTWCVVVGLRDGLLLVDVPEPAGNKVSPISVALLEKHREHTDQGIVRMTAANEQMMRTKPAGTVGKRKRPAEPPAKPRERLVAAGLSGDDAAVPRVVLKLRYPPAAPSLTQQLAAEWPARLPCEAALWPSGGKWMPSTKNWGTRSPIAFGCGKCRWRPLGCRGCIAAAEGYCSPTPPPLPPGTVSIPKRGVDEDCDRVDAASDDVPDRHSGLRRLLSSVAVVSEGVVDDEGSGVVARKLIRKGELLIDPSVIFVARPSGYAQAHLPQYHALELG